MKITMNDRIIRLQNEIVNFTKSIKSLNSLTISTLIIATLLSLPILVIYSSLFSGFSSTWDHLISTVLPDYIINSLLLMFGVSFGVLIIGVPTAWFTSSCQFKGKTLFTWLLLLPLAFPAYIIAYTYTGLLDFAGPVQTALREITGLNYGEYWFFEIRSLTGAIFMLTLVLYPYVYLLARAAFLEQSNHTLNVCRTLGYNRLQAFWYVSLPLARPAIITGLTLALMETLADYGTVQFFGISTFTTGIYRTFYGLGDITAAAQLSSLLLTFVTFLIIIERYSRRKSRYHTNSEQYKIATLMTLSTRQTIFVWIYCLIPMSLGFIIPTVVLVNWTIFEASFIFNDFIILAWNSLYLAISAAFIAVFLALIMAYTQRIYKLRIIKMAVVVSSLGYALPGTIIAIGIIIPLAWFDHQLIAFFSKTFNIDLGLLFSGSLFALLFAYTVRFLAIAIGPIQSGLDKIKPNIDNAAKSLGSSGIDVLKQIHVPLMKSSFLTALLIVFVDVLKELPATLILRPFDFNTLAVHAFELASDERLKDAAPASLMIVSIGLLPIILLSKSISKRTLSENNG